MLKQKWRLFKACKRGYFSLIVFSCAFLLSMGAEFIANDKPIFLYYKKHLYWPLFAFYPETTFGGSLPLETDYKHWFLKNNRDKHSFCLWPPIRYNYRSVNYHSVNPAPPSRENLLGTDDQGRDVLARILYGFRLSILFGLCVTLLSGLIGLTLGAIQGFFGGAIDLIGQRLIEIWSTLPVLYLLIILSSFVSANFYWILLITLLFSWLTLTHVVRTEVLRCKNFAYIKAAKTLGMGNARLLIKHVLPNATVAALTYLPFILTSAITTLTSLDFLGFGLPIGSPSLGELIAQGKNNIQAPWLGLSAFFTFASTLTLLIFIGEAARDALDPRY